jgi:hypothetical protein
MGLGRRTGPASCWTMPSMGPRQHIGPPHLASVPTCTNAVDPCEHSPKHTHLVVLVDVNVGHMDKAQRRAPSRPRHRHVARRLGHGEGVVRHGGVGAEAEDLAAEQAGAAAGEGDAAERVGDDGPLGLEGADADVLALDLRGNPVQVGRAGKRQLTPRPEHSEMRASTSASSPMRAKACSGSRRAKQEPQDESDSMPSSSWNIRSCRPHGTAKHNRRTSRTRPDRKAVRFCMPNADADVDLMRLHSLSPPAVTATCCHSHGRRRPSHVECICRRTQKTAPRLDVARISPPPSAPVAPSPLAGPRSSP